MEINEKHCRSCKYHGWLGNHAITCDYILIRKERRGCPVGPSCTRYERGVRKKTPPELVPSLFKLEEAINI